MIILYGVGIAVIGGGIMLWLVEYVVLGHKTATSVKKELKEVKRMKRQLNSTKHVRSLGRILITISAIFVGSLVFGITGFAEWIKHTPITLSKLTKQQSPTVVYTGTGKVYMKIGSVPANLTYRQIPANLKNALVATEDHNFWNGSSIDLRSILRSLFVDAITGSKSQGASTIEEQLAKIVYLNDDKTVSYKLKEMAMGVQIDRYFTKQQTFTMYMNKVFLGENTVGIDEAAMRYFGVNLKKNPNQLTLADAALLAGLPQAPSAYDPLSHPQAALERRNVVLQNMLKYGYITKGQAQKAEAAPLGAKFHSIPGQSWNTHPLFTNVLFDYAAKQGISSQKLLQGGLKIYTTIDPKVQNAVNEVFWDKKYDSDFPGKVEGAAVFVNPTTGGLLGAAGSRKTGFAHFGTDRIYSDSSPGSSIKPIMEYAPAIQSGQWTPSSILNNTPHDFGGGYDPQNWEGPAGPSHVTLQYALQESQNVASVWLLQQIGLQTGAKFAENDGIVLTKKDKEHLGIAIGGMQHGVNPLEMAQAYEAFDDKGAQMKVHLINRVVNQDGQTTYQFHPSSKRIMSSQTAATMTQLMEDVVNAGTGTSAQVAGWDVAGKTGTVQYSSGLQSSEPNWIRDAWFDGYTPNLVGSIHIGYDISSPQHHMTMYPLDPSANAAKIFADIVRLAEQGTSPKQFNVSSAYTQGKTTGSQETNKTTSNATSNATNNTANNTTNTSGNTLANNTAGNSPANSPVNSPGTGNNTSPAPPTNTPPAPPNTTTNTTDVGPSESGSGSSVNN